MQSDVLNLSLYFLFKNLKTKEEISLLYIKHIIILE